MFPLSVVLFPTGLLPLRVFEPRYRAMTTDCLAGDREFGVVLIERGSEVGGGDQRTDVGTVARIERATQFPDGRWALLARGTVRLRVARWLADDPYPRAEVEVVPDPPGDPVRTTQAVARAEASVRRVRALLSELRDTPPLPSDPPPGTDALGRSWWLCAEAPLAALDRQRLLCTDDPLERMTLLGELADGLAGDLSHLLAGEPGG